MLSVDSDPGILSLRLQLHTRRCPRVVRADSYDVSDRSLGEKPLTRAADAGPADLATEVPAVGPERDVLRLKHRYETRDAPHEFMPDGLAARLICENEPRQVYDEFDLTPGAQDGRRVLRVRNQRLYKKLS